jgi:hypothetical protein
MSYLRPGDKDLHYSDWSHRWLGGDGSEESNEWWDARMALHMQRHATEDDELVSLVPQGIHHYDEYPP